MRNVTDGGLGWPLCVSVEVFDQNMHLTTSCWAYFDAPARADLARLQVGDTVTIVGELDRLALSNLEFIDCELIRAERDGKQIYPRPEAEGEKKP